MAAAALSELEQGLRLVSKVDGEGGGRGCY